MKKAYLFLAAFLFSFLFTAQSEPDQTQSMKAEFRDISQNFMSELKTVLMKNLKEGGPTQAISVCADTAQQLTNLIGKQNGVQLRRVTLKERNPNDKPDEFEKEVLIMFHEKFEAADLTPEDDYFEVIQKDAVSYASYLQPLFVGGPCLTCHGDENKMSDEIKNLLSEKYPDDKAVGYKSGDLRGAISITKEL